LGHLEFPGRSGDPFSVFVSILQRCTTESEKLRIRQVRRLPNASNSSPHLFRIGQKSVNQRPLFETQPLTTHWHSRKRRLSAHKGALDSHNLRS
jgi:hypothetical protein